MRICAEFSDQLLGEINRAVKEKGIGKTQIILEALDQYLLDGDWRAVWGQVRDR
jgi:metal-responsive CopG/Arc/MetJ family transcriptional regulator